MSNLFIKLVFVLIVAISTTECTNKGIKYGDSTYTTNQNAKTNRGIGISAWGLVFLIVSLILLGVGAYYMALFYPILCRKERKYDRIELATV